MRTRSVALLALGALLALTGPVNAQPLPDRLPPAAAAALDQARAACPVGLEAQPGFVRHLDVTGDGVADLVLDYSFLGCGEDPNHFCGTAGCTLQVFASVGGEFQAVYDETVREIRFRTVAGTPRLYASLHGSACNRTGYLPCEQTLAWTGRRFEVLPASTRIARRDD